MIHYYRDSFKLYLKMYLKNISLNLKKKNTGRLRYTFEIFCIRQQRSTLLSSKFDLINTINYFSSNESEYFSCLINNFENTEKL